MNARAHMDAINRACRGRGGKYAAYSCKTVSWDDSARAGAGGGPGGLSAVGPNITDTYLKARDGTALFTVRPDNWNEKLGVVSTSEVAVLTGNHAAGGGRLAPVTLHDFLKQAGKYGQYAGLPAAADLSSDALDTKCSIRFQTTFIPVDVALGWPESAFAPAAAAAGKSRGTLEFATEAYNYQTTTDADPKNLVLLCTTQGTAVQQDGAGANRLYHHAVDPGGKVHRYWLEAEQSDHRVGGPQAETAAERADALARGKATASVIGIRAMGQRFNALMTVQIPLKQKVLRSWRSSSDEIAASMFAAVPMGFGTVGFGGHAGDAGLYYSSEDEDLFGAIPVAAGAAFGSPAPAAPAPTTLAEFAGGHAGEWDEDVDGPVLVPRAAAYPTGPPTACAAAAAAAAAPRAARRETAGRSNAARVSRGSEHDEWPGLSVDAPARHPAEHVTVTIVIYNTVAGGVPTADDVAAAIDDLEALYAACGPGRIADVPFDFMKAPVPAPAQPPPPPSSFLASSIWDTNDSVRCPKGQAMKLCTYTGGGYVHGWTCDRPGCHERGGPTDPRWFCKCCMMDACVKCGDEAIALQKAAAAAAAAKSPAPPIAPAAAPAPAPSLFEIAAAPAPIPGGTAFLAPKRGCPTCKGPLTTFMTQVAGFSCDGCAAKGLPAGTRMHGCRACNYDLCEGCAYADQVADISPSMAVA